MKGDNTMQTENRITLNAHAKINMSLEITGKRDDGYHNIRSFMQGIDLFDVVSIEKCLKNGTKYNLPHCTIEGNDVYLCTDVETIPADKSNLAFRGIEAVLKECGAECLEGYVLVTGIEKRLPVAAGIAGGSGNAAACMLGLNALLGYPMTLRELMTAGVRVGADVPFSIMMNAAYNAGELTGLKGLGEASTAAWISGIGEIVRPAEPAHLHIIMANPGISVSTAAAYRAMDSIGYGTGGASEGNLFVNDMEQYTLAEYPEAARLRAVMRNVLDADDILMTGSGPTIIAYYTDPERCDAGYGTLLEAARGESGWRIWRTITDKEQLI